MKWYDYGDDLIFELFFAEHPEFDVPEVLDYFDVRSHYLMMRSAYLHTDITERDIYEARLDPAERDVMLYMWDHGDLRPYILDEILANPEVLTWRP